MKQQLYELILTWFGTAPCCDAGDNKLLSILDGQYDLEDLAGKITEAFEVQQKL